MKALAIMLLLTALPAAAQVRPMPGGRDIHVQAVDYVPDQIVLLESAPGYQLTVELGPDERIESVTIGDSGSWQVSISRGGNRLFIKPLQGSSTNLSVITDARHYWFDLQAAGEGSTFPYFVQFRYPRPPAPVTGKPVEGKNATGYRLGGKESLWPDGIHDDGVHTYIEWAPEKAIPAIYTVNDQGKETLANGMMRNGLMVIDSIQPKLVFRIDNRRATATRTREGKR